MTLEALLTTKTHFVHKLNMRGFKLGGRWSVAFLICPNLFNPDTSKSPVLHYLDLNYLLLSYSPMKNVNLIIPNKNTACKHQNVLIIYFHASSMPKKEKNNLKRQL